MTKQSPLSLNYSKLQSALGLLGLGLPIVLIGHSIWSKTGLLQSVSDYYHTLVGDIFVGVVFMIGVILLLYRGYVPRPILANSPKFWHRIPDRYVSLCAGGGAIVLALFPVRACTNGAITGFQICSNTVHYAAAFAFIAATAVFCIVLFPRGNGTEHNVVDHQNTQITKLKPSPANCYFIGLGILILIAMAVMLIDAVALKFDWRVSNALQSNRVFFWAEVTAIWAFAFAWLEQARSRFSPFGWFIDR